MTPSETIRDYHRRTKHRLDRYAAGPSNLNWDAQPDPFRHWRGARRCDLPRSAAGIDIPWSALAEGRAAAAFDLAHLGNLLQLSSAITAWKQYGDDRWALRAHPSSGNLHPTETWVIAHRVDGLPDGLHHYQARDHSVEWRAKRLAAAETPGLWLGYSSIPWREAWKYGERAFRYCQLDLGHVLAALAYAAALFGWRASLVDLDPSTLAHGLGLDRHDEFADVEPEEAEVLVALHPAGTHAAVPPPLEWDEWSGLPSLLDPNPLYQWPVIDAAQQATRGRLPPPSGEGQGRGDVEPQPSPVLPPGESRPAADVILTRRSAQAFDGRSILPIGVFRRLLASLLPGGSPVWALWTTAPRVHPAIFVHRVEGLAPGLYLLPRSEPGLLGLTEALRREFAWDPADDTLPLYRLIAARTERTARNVSCHQDIASHSAFTVMFLAEFATPIDDNPAAWRYLHWEAGMLGHCLTLEAEAAVWRGTGIGCFFDDAAHEILGLTDERFQVIYHYAIGMPLIDNRITTLPAYD